MNRYLILALGFVVGFSDWARAYARETRRSFRITIEVVDDLGAPIEGAQIGLSTFHHWERGEGFGRDVSSIYEAVSNAQGIATIEGKSLRGDTNYGPRLKSGYYSGGDGKFRFREVRDGRWDPWDPTVKVVMKRIVNPIPLYARKVGNILEFKIPAFNHPYGFDLVTGDWVAPHGKGKTPDIIYTIKELVPYTVGSAPFDYVLEVAFSREGDGILAVPSDNSVLRVPHSAPERGYQPTFQRQMARFEKGDPIKNEVSADRNYFFRVRTVLDEHGQIKEALYGKIYGEIEFGVNRRLIFNYFLNPTSLDRNLEFDPGRNLFTRLDTFEEVTMP